MLEFRLSEQVGAIAFDLGVEGIELWLESRRLGDFKRWAALSRPGTSDDMTGRNLCFATPLSEKQTNPNF